MEYQAAWLPLEPGVDGWVFVPAADDRPARGTTRSRQDKAWTRRCSSSSSAARRGQQSTPDQLPCQFRGPGLPGMFAADHLLPGARAPPDGRSGSARPPARPGPRGPQLPDDPHALQLVPSEHVPADWRSRRPGRGLRRAAQPEIAAQLLAPRTCGCSTRRRTTRPPGSTCGRRRALGAVAVVLDRTAADAVPTVSAHLARMLASRGLKDSPLFTVQEAIASRGGRRA